jgi:hypothetical protein
VLDTLWKKPLPTHPPPSPRERSHTGSITTYNGQKFMHNPSLHDHYRPPGIQTQNSQKISSAMASRSHSVDFQNCVRSNFHRELHRLSLCRMVGPPISHPPTHDRLTLWLSGMRDKQSTQGSMQVRTVQTGDVPTIPEQTQIHAFLVQRMYEGFSAGVIPVHLLAVRESNGGGGAFLTAHPGTFSLAIT